MKRLKHLLCANNRIQRLESDLPIQLPNLETLILNNNQIQSKAFNEYFNYLYMLKSEIKANHTWKEFLI